MRKRAIWEPNPETILQDLLALADQEERPRARRRSPREVAWIMQKAKAEKAKARREAAWAKRRAADIARNTAKHARGAGTVGVGLFLSRMEPGEWYAVGDVAGRDHGRRGWFLQRLFKPGLVERRRNAEFDGNIYRRENPPHWLYRMTPKGEARRALHFGANHLQKGEGEVFRHHGVDRDRAAGDGLAKVD